MRLTDKETKTILNAFESIDDNAEIYLFGSRIDDTKRGGDIDLLVHSQDIDKKILRRVKWQLLELLGEQKIDILLSKQLKEPFVRLILPTSVKLHH